jgi:hypothetical protein
MFGFILFSSLVHIRKRDVQIHHLINETTFGSTPPYNRHHISQLYLSFISMFKHEHTFIDANIHA